jgi:hypothetical protein
MNLRNLPVAVQRRAPVALLPNNYLAACAALRECFNVDECAEWSNRAAALASYARQAGDKSLIRDAEKIHVRAERRVGELLTELYPNRMTAHAVSKVTNLEPNRVGVVRVLASVSESEIETHMAEVGKSANITPGRVRLSIRRKEWADHSAKVDRENPRTKAEKVRDRLHRIFNYMRFNQKISYASGLLNPNFRDSDEVGDDINWKNAALGCMSMSSADEMIERLADLEARARAAKELFEKRREALRLLGEPHADEYQ